MHPSAQQLKSSSINRHADMFLALIEEQRQMAVLQAHKELESCKATMANFQFNAGQVTNAYKMKVDEAMRDAQKQREEVSALSRLLDYAHLQQRQLVDENNALKAKMGSATSVVTAYLDEQARLAQSVSTSNSSSPGREAQLVPKSEDGYGVAGGASAATHGIDQFAQTEPVPGSSSPLSSNIPFESTPVSSTSRRASEEEERLRNLCKRLDSENQTTTFGKIMGEVAHKKEVDSLKQSLDDLQRKYELLSKSTSRESSSGNQSNAIMAIKVEEAATSMQSEKEKCLIGEVERLKALVSKLEGDKLAANREMETTSNGFKEQIQALKVELEEAKSKSHKSSRSSGSNPSIVLEVPDFDDEITHVATKKRRITIDLT